MSGDEIIKEIDNLEEVERKKVLAHVRQKYFNVGFTVGSNYDFWNNEADDRYDELYGDSKNGVAPSTEEES